MMKKLILIFLSFIIFSTHASEKLKQLSKSQLKRLITNKMILLTNIGKYNSGDIFTPQNSMIVVFYKNGIQKGKLTYAPAGKYHMDTGHWWLKGKTLCARWDNWEKGSFCTNWFKLGDHYLIFDPKGKFRGIIYKKNIV